MTLPTRLSKRKADTGRPQRDRCPGHLSFVRSHGCCVPGCEGRPIEAAHVRTHGDGGMGLKPSDDRAISLCRDHHAEQHRVGELTFQRRHGIDMLHLAREFAAASPAWKRYLAKKSAER